MRAVAVAFSRDRDVLASCARVGSGASSPRPPHPRVYTAMRFEAVAGEDEKRRTRRSVASVYPPSGVVPFKGLARLIAPLCYLYPHPADVHSVFKRLYARLFKNLHALDDDAFPRPAFPGLIALFEDALFDAEPTDVLGRGVPYGGVLPPIQCTDDGTLLELLGEKKRRNDILS